MSDLNPHPGGGAPEAQSRRAKGARVRGAETVRLGLLAVVLAVALVLFSLPDHDGGTGAIARTDAPARLASPSLLRTSVTIPAEAGSVRVPASYFGLSTEYWALPLYERQLPLFERVLSLLHLPGAGPTILRIGGDSADLTFWDPRVGVPPAWAFRLTPPWLQQTSLLVRRAGLRLILDLNLVTGSPLIAANWARVAEEDLPRRSIIGFEVGNEPDIYSRWYWRAITARAMLGGGVLPRMLSADSYTRAFNSFARVLALAAPSVPVAGPALANPTIDVKWISHLLAHGHRQLGIVTAHRYPYSACAERFATSYPTINRLLSETASAGTARAVGPAVRLAHLSRLPFRLTELNSVTCRGRRGVSDTFATALWAPDALFELLRAGVAGVNLHLRAGAVNAPFTLNPGGLNARPLLYGMALFARALGAGSQLIQVPAEPKRSLHLKVWAVRARGGNLRVLMIDKGPHPVRVDLRLPAGGTATVQRLLAASAWSRTGVTLDGQWLGVDGRWRGRPTGEKITRGAHGYQLTLPRQSAALLSMHLVSPHRSRGAPRALEARRSG